MKKNKLKFGFTLAEVLITLGIIGVVAALTLPTLIQHHKKSVVETRLKKFYTTMNQAILMAKNDYGDFENWDFFLGNKYDEEANLINQSEATKARFEKYFKPYLNIVKIEEIVQASGEKNYLYYLADGSAFHFGYYSTIDVFYMPDNPHKCLPPFEETLGKCKFVFGFHPIAQRHSTWSYHRDKGIEPYKKTGMENFKHYIQVALWGVILPAVIARIAQRLYNSTDGVFRTIIRLSYNNKKQSILTALVI